MTRHPVIRGHFLRAVSYLPPIKEPVTKPHLSCRDTFSVILRCPLKTGFTVQVCYSSLLSPSEGSHQALGLSVVQIFPLAQVLLNIINYNEDIYLYEYDF